MALKHHENSNSRTMQAFWTWAQLKQQSGWYQEDSNSPSHAITRIFCWPFWDFSILFLLPDFAGMQWLSASSHKQAEGEEKRATVSVCHPPVFSPPGICIRQSHEPIQNEIHQWGRQEVIKKWCIHRYHAPRLKRASKCCLFCAFVSKLLSRQS